MNFGGHFDIDKKSNRLKEISELESLDGFWEDVAAASKVQRERSIIEDTLNSYQSLVDLRDEFEILCEYAKEDESSAVEAISVIEKLDKEITQVEKKVLLSGELDSNNAIVTINAGAGGTESCDWASMLFRMITRWVEIKGFKYQVLDSQEGDSAGIKSATLMISGVFSYGLLKSEIGVHRLVRISPFDSNARRHTSFASVFVSPEVDDNIEIEVRDNDLKIDVYRAGGAGGQSVNTTDSAVRITHLPTNIVVTCQNERSQLQNKAQAMKVLKSRLYDLEMAKRKEESDQRESEKKEIGWGAQIRSYVLHPYKMVKDHRTGFESSNPDKILDGDLDNFIDQFLRWSVTPVESD